MRKLAFLLSAILASTTGCQQAATDPAVDDSNASASLPSKENPPPKLLKRKQIDNGWIALFDGQTLFGWKANNDVNWRVEKGEIVADKGEPGLLLTTVPFANYELSCDFHLEKGGNSGIFLRTIADPKDPSKDCYELNMCDTHEEFATGSLVARKKPDVAVEGDGDWHTFHVVVDGPKIVAKFDGKTVIEFEDKGDGRLTNGFVGLQKNAGRIAFRNVLLKPLAMRPLMDDDNGEEWTLVPASKCEVEVKDGVIRMTGGPGYFETIDRFDDFVVQTSAKTNAKDVNSGMFFRAMTGNEDNPANGYECQIHHTFADGDRTKPNDYGDGFGTGSIFRRNRARWVVPNDEEWFTLTLVAFGPRFAVWVDGYQVTDVVDDREPNENARQGLCLHTGHISLQAHDEKSDVSFRGLSVAELPALLSNDVRNSR